MATVQKLLIDVFVAAAAVPRGQLGGDHEAVMILFALAGSGLMAVEAVHTFLGVQAHLVFVNHRILSPGVAFSAFSGGPHEIRRGLVVSTFGLARLSRNAARMRANAMTTARNTDRKDIRSPSQ